MPKQLNRLTPLSTGYRTTLVKVFSGHVGDLRRKREIDDLLSAFSGGYSEKLGEPSQVRNQTAAFIGEARREETSMQATPVPWRRRASFRANKMLHSFEQL
jgi:hypothetical protein